MTVAASPQDVRRRLTAGVLLLDAAMGSELDRHGVSTALPLWSARALFEHPEVVQQIHVENLLAGADIVTTNTFRTTTRTLTRAGRAEDAKRLTRLAVRLARDAIATVNRPEALVAGSIAPLEDCYSPELTPPAAFAEREHRQQARWLADAGVDLLLIETMPTSLEARAATIAATETGLPVAVGVVCRAPASPDDPVRLLSGEPLTEAIMPLTSLSPDLVMANCAAPPVITRALAEIRSCTRIAAGGYANLGVVDPVSGWAADASIDGELYAKEAKRWLKLGARVIGGCCGTTAAHTAALRRLIDQEA